MVSGDLGADGLGVPKPVVRELKLGGESVTIDTSVLITVRVITRNRENVTFAPVQVFLSDMQQF